MRIVTHITALLGCLIIGLNLGAQTTESGQLSFVENRGQWPGHVLFSGEINSGRIFLEKSGLTYHQYDLSAIKKQHDGMVVPQNNDIRIKGHVYRVNFPGCNATAKTKNSEKHKTYYNYYLSDDPSGWAGNCAAYGKITRENFYPGIDFIYYSQDQMLKYDFVLKPGADHELINMKFDAMDSIVIENNRLKIYTSVGIVYEQKPIAWQIIDDKKKYVDCEYHLQVGNTVSFLFPGGYDRNYELVIDPQLVFSTYSGSISDNFGYTATYDNDGFLYSGSSSFGQNYPVTAGAYQTTHNGGDSNIGQGIDMALSKYDVSGTFMVWSTFLGGSGDDLPHSIITNAEDELFVYGTTGSNDFPVTPGAFDVSFAGGSFVSPTGTGANFPVGTDIVVAHFNATGTNLIGSTYLGGTGNDGVCTSVALKHNYADEFRGEISLDPHGNPVIVSSTFSANFPIQNALQPSIGGQQDAVIIKLTPQLNTIMWSTYLGGSLDDSGFSVSFNSVGELYVCGGTASTNFPVSSNSAQNNFGGGIADGYITRISSNGQSILAATYWGQSTYDQLYFIEVDNEDFVYVYGQTTATGSTMIINATYGTPGSGNLLTKFSSNLQNVVWSTVFGTGGSKPTLSPAAFLVDYCNRVYVSGWGILAVVNALNPGQNLAAMNTMQTTADAFDSTCSSGDFYMAVFDENMSQLEYATFYGGGSSSEHVDGGTSRFDSKGIIYQSVCAGCGGFSDFPIQPGNAWSATNNAPGGCNNGVYKFDFQLPITIADFIIAPTGCVNNPVSFTSSSTFAVTYQWNFDGLGTSSSPNPQWTFTQSGTYDITLIVQHSSTCNLTDTITKSITILQPQSGSFNELNLCQGENEIIGPPIFNPEYTYQWTPQDFLSDADSPNPIFQAGNTTSYTLQILHDGCVDIFTQQVNVAELFLTTPNDTTLCDDETLTLTAIYSPTDASVIWSDVEDFSNVLNDNPEDPAIEVSPLIPTTYYVLITSGRCSIQSETQVDLVSFQTLIEGDLTVCANDNTTLTIVNPNSGFTYTWSPENLIISGQSTPQVEITVPEETIFTVVSESPDGCTATDDVTVSVSALSANTFTAAATPAILIQGQTSQLNAQPAGFSYQWTPSTWLNSSVIANPISTPQADISYTVTATDGECTATASVTLKVVEFICGLPSIYVPNAFTPNVDDKNEKLFVRANNISRLYFVIYDRWGEKVFETTSLSEGWDGTFQDRNLDPDVYTYYLEAVCIDGQEYFDKGNITLIR